MKALITGIACLSILAGCAANPPLVDIQSKKDRSLLRAKDFNGGTGFCQANDGIFVILVDTNGIRKGRDPDNPSAPVDITGFACDMIKGKKIEQKASIPPDLTQTKIFNLGTLIKFHPDDPNNTDPCYVWYVNHTRYHVCWP